MILGTTSKRLVARKTHRCEICGQPIRQGQLYERTTGQWQGEWQNWGAHLICLEVYPDTDDGIEEAGWREMARMAHRQQGGTVLLARFLEEFPPRDEEDTAWLQEEAPEAWRLARAARAFPAPISCSPEDMTGPSGQET